MRVSQGIPRVKEIINASKTIATPVITAALDCDNNPTVCSSRQCSLLCIFFFFHFSLVLSLSSPCSRFSIFSLFFMLVHPFTSFLVLFSNAMPFSSLDW
jgi:hypothetical protein